MAVSLLNQNRQYLYEQFTFVKINNSYLGVEFTWTTLGHENVYTKQNDLIRDPNSNEF